MLPGASSVQVGSLTGDPFAGDAPEPSGFSKIITRAVVAVKKTASAAILIANKAVDDVLTSTVLE